MCALNLTLFLYTYSDLYSRELLDEYLSRALGVELEEGQLTLIDDSDYVLTVDYTIKMLNIHERSVSVCTCTLYVERSPLLANILCSNTSLRYYAFWIDLLCVTSSLKHGHVPLYSICVTLYLKTVQITKLT